MILSSQVGYLVIRYQLVYIEKEKYKYFIELQFFVHYENVQFVLNKINSVPFCYIHNQH